MSLPKYPQKYGHPPLFTADALVRQNPKLAGVRAPERVILCFQAHTMHYLVKKRRGKRLPGPPYGEFFLLGSAPQPVGVAGGFGIGAPLAVFMLEWLRAMGARQFVVIGFAGGLLESQSAGDLVVCSGALRDEGTSYHYLPPADRVDPDPGLQAQLSAALDILGYAHTTGPTWTTDAPLRETLPEVHHHRSNGLLTVEMEAAALFAAAQALQVACTAAFTIGDSPRNDRWQIEFDRRALHTGLERLADAAVLALTAAHT